MELSRPPLVVAFELSERRKAIVADALAGASVVIYLTELDGTARAEALRNAGALLTHNTAKDLRSGEAALLHSTRLIQFTIAGVDFIPVVVSAHVSGRPPLKIQRKKQPRPCRCRPPSTTYESTNNA
jgi:hypothetical protein